MEEEKKNKFKKILSYIGCGIGCFILGLCVSNCANNKGKKASNVNNNTSAEVVQNVEHKNIQFNDEYEKVIFDIYDLNNCIYPNLTTYVSTLNDFADWYVEYNGDEFVLDELYTDYVNFINGSYTIWFNFTGDDFGKFQYSYSGDETVYYPFEYSLLIIPNGNEYQSIKSALQQDIEYNNQQYQQSIFGGLTESLVDFIGVIGSGFASVFTIFYAEGHITTFGMLAVIVAGVALAYFLFRFIIGLIRLRG